MIRVMLADDHTVLRESLALVLRGSGDCIVVGEAADGITAIEQALALRPDVAVVDISMPRMSGIEVVRRISNELPRTHALVLTMHDEEEYVLQMIRAGAAGYLLKDAATNELRGADPRRRWRALRTLCRKGACVASAKSACGSRRSVWRFVAARTRGVASCR